jgi:hypothetical protein
MLFGDQKRAPHPCGARRDTGCAAAARPARTSTNSRLSLSRKQRVSFRDHPAQEGIQDAVEGGLSALKLRPAIGQPKSNFLSCFGPSAPVSESQRALSTLSPMKTAPQADRHLVYTGQARHQIWLLLFGFEIGDPRAANAWLGVLGISIASAWAPRPTPVPIEPITTLRRWVIRFSWKSILRLWEHEFGMPSILIDRAGGRH